MSWPFFMLLMFIFSFSLPPSFPPPSSFSAPSQGERECANQVHGGRCPSHLSHQRHTWIGKVLPHHNCQRWCWWWQLFRFPINFKSEVEETSLLSGRKFFYHVVLGIAYKGAQDGNFIGDRHVTFYACCVKFFSKWFPGKLGAVGLSRRSSLMDKPVILFIITIKWK